MSMISNRAQQIAISIEDKAYTDAFVDAEITTTVPFQLREMRKQRGWKQQDVADLIDGNQKTISDFENPNYARYTLTSLKKLASAFDVALIVRFAPYSELIDWASTLKHERLAVPARKDDARLKAHRQGLEESGNTTTNGGPFIDLPTDGPVVREANNSTTRDYSSQQDAQSATVLKFKPKEAA